MDFEDKADLEKFIPKEYQSKRATTFDKTPLDYSKRKKSNYKPKNTTILSSARNTLKNGRVVVLSNGVVNPIKLDISKYKK